MDAAAMQALAQGMLRGAGGPDAERATEERLAKAAELKEAGNALFRAGDAQRALVPWNHALLYLRGLSAAPGSAQDAAAKKLRAVVELNLAQAHHTRGANSRALAHATEAVALAPDNAKALFRRGRARRIAGDVDGARADLAAACRIDPKSAEVRAEMRLVEERAVAEEARERRVFAEAFRRAQEDVPI